MTAATQAAPGGERWIIQVHDRPAAVERVLGTLRRRRVEMDDLAVARASATVMSIAVAVRVGPTTAARVCAELRASPDVVQVERSHEEADARPHQEPAPEQDEIP